MSAFVISAPTPAAARALYVPLHRRTPSSSSVSSPFESPSSTPPRIYTLTVLLALNNAQAAEEQKSGHVQTRDETMHARIERTCPEVLRSSRLRKSDAFKLRKARREAEAQQSTPEQPSAVHLQTAPAAQTAAAPIIPTRTPSRRTRPAGRGPERRRAAVLSFGEGWRSPRVI